ncbi:MAG TPA: cysteine--tRNA ligase [Oligoflexia bacterium]|nr:cysteine--tRNA ligase [Oligoflexia bacterium]HMR25401.1 cysteine--tRNA ligase [Oligoflexia bacterium]
MRLHDSMSGTLRKFVPHSDFEVKMYVCGPTVYDHSHIGHARCYIAYDIIYRYLNFKGYHVKYVRNITDIDDKIINKALDEGVDFSEIAQKYTESFHADLNALGLLSPDEEPKVSETMDEIIAMIETLIKKEKAYVANNGDVYFSVKNQKDYGKLSKRKLDQLRAGARVAPGEEKKDPLDFVLWKHAKPGEPSWESPWGEGRPGWHIECSAMNSAIFGEQIDIHGGGRDLIFPHHENEIAQTEACTGKEFSKYWLHNGFVTTKNEKMSKSEGNVTTIKNLIKQVHPEALKLYFMSTHYRHPIEFSLEGINEAAKSLNRMYKALDFAQGKRVHPEYLNEFQQAMDEDFNTPKAMTTLHAVTKAIYKAEDERDKQELANTLQMLANVLGLLQLSKEEYQSWYEKNYAIDASWVEEQIVLRAKARADKDFKTSDSIRDQLDAKGIQIEDSPDGTTWSVKL